MTQLSLSASLPVVSLKTRVLSALMAMAMGFGILFATGFAQPSALHNATHDSRHAFVFPCH